MKKRYRILLSAAFSFLILVLAAVVFLSAFLRGTVFSETYLRRATDSPNYILMLKQTAGFEFDAQSRYVGIPLEYFVQGMDEEKIEVLISEHISVTSGFMNQKNDFEKSVYPKSLFTEQFTEFITGIEEEVTPEQMELLNEVAKDSSAIMGKHINLLRMDLIKDRAVFQRFHSLLIIFRNILLPSLFGLLICVLAVFYLNRKNIRSFIFYSVLPVWILGAMLLVPGVVLSASGISRRLAIRTPYFKFAIDTWLSSANKIIVITGIVLFVFSSAALALRHININRKN